MPVVRGDRLGESRKINRLTIEIHDFYAAFVAAAVPDDFGRYRKSAAHVFLKMYPRREPTPSALRRVDRILKEFVNGDEPLAKEWEVDGVTFCELTNWKPTGNMVHRTPEPEWSDHSHSKRCAKTAIARAREWGDVVLANQLAKWLLELGGRKVEGGSKEGRRGACTPSNPLYPSTPSNNGNGLTDPALRAPFPSARAVDIYRRHRPGDPPKAIFKPLRNLVTKHGWDAVEPELDAYLQQTPLEFESIAGKFLPGFGEWVSKLGRASPSKPSVGDKALAEAQEFLNRRRA